MFWKANGRSRPSVWISALVLGSVAAAGGVAANKALARRPAYLGLARAAAARSDLRPALQAGGNVDTAQKTIIKCELDAQRATTIIELVPDGTIVEKGQMLARLDASEYEEQVRLNEILLLQSEADEQKAELDLEVALIAIEEYRDGLLVQSRRDYQARMALVESNVLQQKDRMKWDEKMLAKGYISRGQFQSDRMNLHRSEVSLTDLRGEVTVMDRYTAGNQVHRMRAAIDVAREALAYQKLRLEKSQEQLKRSRAQVEACTIRAPHSGRVIYANAYNPTRRVEEGNLVFHNLDLFYLPDLSRLEVHAEIHETSINRVRVGQPVIVRVDGLPDGDLQGHVKSVDMLPREPRDWKTAREVRNFLVKVAIHAAPPGVLPGRTAALEILEDVRPDVLVVPTTAVSYEDGGRFVYVAGRGGLERRAVGLVPGDSQRTEVVSGLAEGEEVIVDPGRLDPAEARAALTVALPTETRVADAATLDLSR